MAGAIIKGEEHFFTTIYEGNGGGQRVGKFVPFTDNGTIANSVIFNYDEAHILDKTFVDQLASDLRNKVRWQPNNSASRSYPYNENLEYVFSDTLEMLDAVFINNNSNNLIYKEATDLFFNTAYSINNDGSTDSISGYPLLSISDLDDRFSERFDDTNYYHGSGSYGGPS